MANAALVALVADIHANFVALKAVEEDIARELGPNAQIRSLGDVVGYGPKPVECTDWVMQRAKWSLMGNHDQGVMFDPGGFNATAEKAIYWTRELIERLNRAKKDPIFEFYGDLPRRMVEFEALFVHASPLDPISDYVKPEHIYVERKMSAIAAKIDRLAFCGHTHLPGVFDLSATPSFTESADLPDVVELKSLQKALVNVGSVGQPRDGDPRACYVIFDTVARTIRYRRVEYNIDIAVKDFENIKELDASSANRLRRGA